MLRLQRVDEKATETTVVICQGYVEEAQGMIEEMRANALDWKDTEGLADMRARAIILAEVLDKAINARMRLEGEVC